MKTKRFITLLLAVAMMLAPFKGLLEELKAVGGYTIPVTYEVEGVKLTGLEEPLDGEVENRTIEITPDPNKENVVQNFEIHILNKNRPRRVVYSTIVYGSKTENSWAENKKDTAMFNSSKMNLVLFSEDNVIVKKMSEEAFTIGSISSAKISVKVSEVQDYNENNILFERRTEWSRKEIDSANFWYFPVSIEVEGYGLKFVNKGFARGHVQHYKMWVSHESTSGRLDKNHNESDIYENYPEPEEKPWAIVLPEYDADQKENLVKSTTASTLKYSLFRDSTSNVLETGSLNPTEERELKKLSEGAKQFKIVVTGATDPNPYTGEENPGTTTDPAVDAEKDAKIAELEAQITEANKKNAELQTQINTLNTKVTELEKSKQELEKQLASAGGDATEVAKELEAKNLELAKANEKIASLTTEKETLQTSLDAKNAELTEANKKFEAEKAKVEDLTSKLNAEKAKATTLEQEKQALTTEKEALTTELETEKANVKTLTEEKEALQAELEEIKASEAGNVEKIANLEEQIEEKDKQIEEKTAKLEELEATIEEKETTIAEKEAKAEEVKGQVVELEKEVKEKTEKVTELEAEVKAATEEKEALQTELDEKKAEETVATEEKAKLEEKIEELTNSLSEANKKIAELEKQINETKKTIEEKAKELEASKKAEKEAKTKLEAIAKQEEQEKKDKEEAEKQEKDPAYQKSKLKKLIEEAKRVRNPSEELEKTIDEAYDILYDRYADIEDYKYATENIEKILQNIKDNRRNRFKLDVDDFDVNSKEFTGKTEIKWYVDVYNGKKRIANGQADYKGNFTLDIKKNSFKAGDKLKFSAVDPLDDKKYKEIEIEVEGQVITNENNIVVTEDMLRAEGKDPQEMAVFPINENYYNIIEHGKKKTVFMDATSYAANGRTMLPIRYVANALGFNVEWDTRTKEAIFTNTSNPVLKKATFRMNVFTGYIYGSDGTEYRPDQAPVVKDGRTYVSISNVVKAFGGTHGDVTDGVANTIEWDQAHKAAILYKYVK